MKVGDSNACLFCGVENGLDGHHVVPRRYGGSDHPGNKITVCKACHHKLERVYDSAFFSEFEPLSVSECGACGRGGPMRRVDTDRTLISECSRCGQIHIKEYVDGPDGVEEVVHGD